MRREKNKDNPIRKTDNQTPTKRPKKKPNKPLITKLKKDRKRTLKYT